MASLRILVWVVSPSRLIEDKWAAGRRLNPGDDESLGPSWKEQLDLNEIQWLQLKGGQSRDRGRGRSREVASGERNWQVKPDRRRLEGNWKIPPLPKGCLLWWLGTIVESISLRNLLEKAFLALYQLSHNSRLFPSLSFLKFFILPKKKGRIKIEKSFT